MPSPSFTIAARPSGTARQAPPRVPVFFSGLWTGVQATVDAVFRRHPAPARDRSPDSTPPLPAPERRPPPAPAARRAGSLASTPAFIEQYANTLASAWRDHDWSDVTALVETLHRCWQENRQVFLCGNGGSAANAIHLANDLLYGIDKATGHGLRVIALPANAAVLTCLANDLSYEDVFAQQLTVLSTPGDVLIALSGSGNSPNILKALTRARELDVTTFAILGFTGGQALKLVDHPIYFPVHDMQVAEDLQMMVGHMAMQWLSAQPLSRTAEAVPPHPSRLSL